MEREECEKLIRDKLVEIREIYKTYRGETEVLYLSMWLCDEDINFNNAYFKDGIDMDKPINYHEDG